MMLLIRQVSAQGFLIPQFGGKFPEGIQQMAQWIQDGDLTYREDIVEGLKNTQGFHPHAQRREQR